MDGETAIVTGGASGIGRETATRLAREGANVVVADVLDVEGRATVEEIESAGGTASFVETDVSDPNAVEAMVAEAVGAYESLDVAVNNAGIEGENDPTAEQTEANWDRVLDINLKGVWLCMKYELQEMAANGGGSIVNTSSIAGLSAAGAAPYAASKHGIVGLTRVAATEYAEADVRVNAVCPGVIETPMVEQAAEEIEQFVGMQPLGRMGQPEEVASAVVWLSSDEASFVTGTAYPIDGGFTAR
ncbi:glucose 1-dehydrogenase [Natronococcus sp. A-GB1]|uniref:glucose 1-dehydrogenase n=1 Tax=Natronococcus sp. A-GB1 TaxID=3037648 RepID=UPI0031F2D8E0